MKTKRAPNKLFQLTIRYSNLGSFILAISMNHTESEISSQQQNSVMFIFMAIITIDTIDLSRADNLCIVLRQ